MKEQEKKIIELYKIIQQQKEHISMLHKILKENKLIK
jgi:hypothetical protein